MSKSTPPSSTHLLPPVPESPNRLPTGKTSGTPRVGMHLYQNDDDDDVSVLTFHTMGTKDTGGSNASFVKSARESIEKLILESKNSTDDDGVSLSRISEEGGSQVSSSCNSKKGCDRSNSSSEISDGRYQQNKDDCGDDETISLAESILDSANKVLSRIGSSPYYGGRSKIPSPKCHKGPLPWSNISQSSPKRTPKQPFDEVEGTKSHSTNLHGTIKEMASNERCNVPDQQLEVSSKFLSSYFRDENAKPFANSSFRGKYSSADKNTTHKGGKAGEDLRIKKLESETKQLQLQLKERQLETRKASESLGSSIKRANELLQRISIDRNTN